MPSNKWSFFPDSDIIVPINDSKIESVSFSERSRKMKSRAFIAALLCLAFLIMGETESAAVSTVRIVGEFLAGGACGIAGVYGTGWLVYLLKSWYGDPDSDNLDSWYYGTAVCSSVLSSSIGVYLVGTIGDETGSFLATLAGAALGSLLPNGCCLGLYIP